MTQGFLLFAHDNEQIQYSLMAAWQAQRITKWLGKPVSIVTDQQSVDNLIARKLDPNSIFDKVLLSDSNTSQQKRYQNADDSQTLTFKNVDRSMAWDLTPYDETLVIDTDIVIQSNRLNTVWNNSEDMLVCRNSTDVFDRKFVGFDYLSNYGIQFCWATVFYFKKNETTQLFFDTCKRIKEMYNWFSFVYDLGGNYIRNDHVWSIALHELGGSAGNKWALDIPIHLPYTLDRDQLVAMTDDSITVLGDNKLRQLKNIDTHIMNKYTLMEHVVKEMSNV
jgi:hypothetical protein